MHFFSHICEQIYFSTGKLALTKTIALVSVLFVLKTRLTLNLLIMFLNGLYFNELTFYVQHFPMYRESDAECFEPDEAPADEKNYKFRERWECISRESSEFVSTLS